MINLITSSTTDPCLRKAYQKYTQIYFADSGEI